MKGLISTRRRFLGGAAALGAAAGVGLPRWSMAQDRPSVLRLRFDGGNSNLDPGYMIGGTEVETQKQCLPFLTEYAYLDDGTLAWRPTYYVTKFEQRDPTHIDFELADFLEWTGGHGPVTAADVKYSFERMKGTDWSGYYDAMDHVEVTGERTGTIVLSQPFAPFVITTLCHGTGAILSEKAMKEVGETFTTEFPATAGPYLYDQIPGQRATFKPNPDWKGPKPDFDEVVCNIITEVKAAELAFEAGELDCTEIGADTLARYQANPPEGAAVAVAGELQYMWLGMNTEHPLLQDKTVRRAIQHAVDVESILQGAYSGTTAKSNGIVCPGLIGHRDATKHYSYDPEKARQLLEEAGVSESHPEAADAQQPGTRCSPRRSSRRTSRPSASISKSSRSTAGRSGTPAWRKRATPGRTSSSTSCASRASPTPTRRRSGSFPNRSACGTGSAGPIPSSTSFITGPRRERHREAQRNLSADAGHHGGDRRLRLDHQRAGELRPCTSVEISAAPSGELDYHHFRRSEPDRRAADPRR